MAAETLRHNCGVMGIWNDDNAAELVFHGLYSLQHRGQESAGIVSADDGRFYRHFGMGTLTQVFSGPFFPGKKGRQADFFVRCFFY